MIRTLSLRENECLETTAYHMPAGATQVEIAQEMGVSPQYVNNMFRKFRKEYTREEVADGISEHDKERDRRADPEDLVAQDGRQALCGVGDERLRHFH